MAVAGGSGGGHGLYSPPKRQKVDPGFTLRPKAAPRPSHHTAAPVYSPPVQSFSSNHGGQYSGGGGGGLTPGLGGGGRPHNPPPTHKQGHVNRPGHGGGNNGNGGKNNAPAKSAVPNLQKYLAGDSAYQDQLSQLMKQLEDFKTQNTGQQADVGEDFQTALNKMNLKRSQDLESLQNDFASRGLLNSGLYTNAVGDYNNDYQQNLGDLNTDKQRSLDQLLQGLQQYQQENTTARSNAKQEAIRRRAQQFGLK